MVQTALEDCISGLAPPRISPASRALRYGANMQEMIDRAGRILDQHRVAVLLTTIAALSVLAWSNRFIQDDAFISFRYARNLVEGAGLTYNPGERVEGYTNFLWTLLMALPFWLGFDPVRFSQGLGIALFPGSLYLSYRIARSATGSFWAAFGAVVFLGTNYTFSIYATGGLETQLQLVLLLGVIALALETPRTSALTPLRACGISLLSAAALATRLDSALPLCLLYLYIGGEMLPEEGRASSRPLRTSALLIVPGALLVSIWLIWKLSYYGDILPNTYYAKMIAVSDSLWPGLRYVWIFARSYWLLPLIFIPFLLRREIRENGNRKLGLLGLLCVVVIGYAIRIGGDFMEFRMMVPALPALFILLAWLMSLLPLRPWGVALCSLLVIGGSVYHAYTFTWYHGIESARQLENHVYQPDEAWAKAGEVLGELFGDEDDPAIIATTAAGVLPFRSRLPCIDMHGVTDAWVARNGIRANPRLANPGHQRAVPFSYLVKRRVNLVLGRIWVEERKPGPPPAFGRQGLAGFSVHDPPYRQTLPEDAVMHVLEINLDDHYKLFVLYLMRSRHIDAVVAKNHIRRHSVMIRRKPS